MRGEFRVATFMDVHNMEGGVSAEDVAKAHQADVETQEKYGVNYKSYWVDEKGGKIFCLVDAPDAETAHTVHREAHGLVADEIYEVKEGA
jgi:Nickel responsive protein SCO4226-like